MRKPWSAFLLLAFAGPGQVFAPQSLHEYNNSHATGAIERIPEPGLNYRPTPEVRTVRELLGHVAQYKMYAQARVDPDPTPEKKRLAPPSDPPPPARSASAPTQMVTYYLGFLVRGPRWTPEQTPALEQLQESHLAHMRKMHEAGRLVIAGPLTDGGRIRGIVLYRGASLEECQAWAEADPAVQAGRLAVEMHPWMVQKGILPE